MSGNVRFTIRADEQESDVISIRETSNDDLIMLIKRSNQIGNGLNDVYENTKEFRISVHNTEGRYWNTIKTHIRLDNGFYRKVYARVIPMNGRIIWLCMGFSAPDLSQNHHASKYNKNDRIISMGHYKPKYSILTYFIVIATSPLIIKPPRSMNVAVAKFNKFNVHIFWAFMGSSSFHQGEFSLGAGFGEDEFDGNVVDRFREFEVSRSLYRKSLCNIIDDLLRRFSEAHIFKFRRFVEKDDFILPEDFEKFARSYFKEPILP